MQKMEGNISLQVIQNRQRKACWGLMQFNMKIKMVWHLIFIARNVSSQFNHRGRWTVEINNKLNPFAFIKRLKTYGRTYIQKRADFRSIHACDLCKMLAAYPSGGHK